MPVTKNAKRKLTQYGRVKHRQADARYRAGVQQCFNLLLHVVPQTAKANASKLTVLEHTGQYISDLENALSKLNAHQSVPQTAHTLNSIYSTPKRPSVAYDVENKKATKTSDDAGTKVLGTDLKCKRRLDINYNEGGDNENSADATVDTIKMESDIEWFQQYDMLPMPSDDLVVPYDSYEIVSSSIPTDYTDLDAGETSTNVSQVIGNHNPVMSSVHCQSDSPPLTTISTQDPLTIGLATTDDQQFLDCDPQFHFSFPHDLMFF